MPSETKTLTYSLEEVTDILKNHVAAQTGVQFIDINLDFQIGAETLDSGMMEHSTPVLRSVIATLS